MAKPCHGTPTAHALRSASRRAAAAGTRLDAPTSACCRRRARSSSPSERSDTAEGRRTMRSRHLRTVRRRRRCRWPIYARVSSDQQAERHTIDSQLGELKARAVAGRPSHPGRHAVRRQRPQRRQPGPSRPGAPARPRRLSAVDILYVHAPDRLARSYAHQVLLLEEFARAGYARWCSSTGRSATAPRTTCCCSCRGCSRSTSGPRCWSAAAAASGTAPRRAPSASFPARPSATATSAARPAAGRRATRSTRTPPGWSARSSPG